MALGQRKEQHITYMYACMLHQGGIPAFYFDNL